MAFNISQTKVSFETPSTIVFDKKFDTALRDSFLKPFINRRERNEHTLDDKVLMQSDQFDTDVLSLKRTSDHYPKFLMELLSQSQSLSPVHSTAQLSQKIHDHTLTSIKMQIDYMLENNYTHLFHRIKSLMNHDMSTKLFPPEVIHLMDFAIFMIDTIQSSNKLIGIRKTRKNTEEEVISAKCKVSFKTYHRLSLKFVWNHDLLYTRIHDEEYISPKSVLLMFHNKVCDLISVLLLAWRTEGNSNPRDSYDLTLNFVKELCRLRVRYGEKSFEILKSLEGLGIAETLIQVESWKNTEFLKCITDDIYDSTGFDYFESELRTLMLLADIPLRHELMCLSKITGHPYVNMAEGAKSLYDKVNEIYKINLLKVNQCVNYCKENYIRNHILRYGRWPPCSLNNLNAPRALMMSFIEQKDPSHPSIIKRFGKVDIQDYIYIDLEQNMHFSKVENVIPHLKDKTISVLRSKVLKHYLEAKEEAQGEDAKIHWKDTRLLLSYLLNPSMVHNHQEYMDRYATSDHLDELLDYLVIRIVPKEKELKVQFRGFGCKTYEDRERSLEQESEVMRFLDEFSDEQAMTLGELSLLKKLDGFRRLRKAYTNHHILYIVVDASSWNNHFRDETVRPVMNQTLDKIFNYPIFSKTHEAYQNTLVYVPDTASVFSWKGQAGGIEGLNQDTWVVTYLAQIKTALEGLDFKYHILCKGDDLRIAVAIPSHLIDDDEVSRMKNKIVTRLANAFKDFGHKIKIEESYGSSKYFAFSKSASVDNVELPQAFRKIQKCYGATNAFIATLDEYIGSTVSNAHSACKTAPNVLPQYYVALFWMYFYLRTHNMYNKLSDDQLVALSVIPSVVGGFPIIFLHNMHVRAESDLLSPFIGLYQFCKKTYRGVAEVMENFMILDECKPTSFIGIYKDPYSLPLARPRLPASYLRSQILPILQQVVKNEDVKELFDLLSDVDSDPVVKALDTCNVINSKVLANIFAASPLGIIEELKKKFESSRSVHELLILRLGKRKADKILRNTVRHEIILQSWRVQVIKGQYQGPGKPYNSLVNGDCPSYCAQRIREFAWGRRIEGITMPPLQHQIGLYPAYSQNEWVKQNHFTYYCTNPTTAITKDQREQYATGGNAPFVGYTTRTGNIAPTVNFLERDPILIKLKNLLDLASWTNVTTEDEAGNHIISNSRDLINKVIGLYTKTTLNQLAPFASVRRSGTTQHHTRSPSFKESIVPNVLSNTYTRLQGESDSHITLRTSRNHYKINFLHVMCYNFWQLSLELEYTTYITTPQIVWGVTTPCRVCNTPIVETALTFDPEKIQKIRFTPLALTKINAISEKILAESLRSNELKNFRNDEADVELEMEIAERGILQEVMQNMYYSKINLQHRYTGHTVTHEGLDILASLHPKSTNKDVGLTEIKRLSAKRTSEYLFEIIHGLLITPLSTKDELSISTYLMGVSSLDLPWYGLVCFLHKIGMLPKVVNDFAQRSGVPVPPCHYSPSSACVYLAVASKAISVGIAMPQDVVILSYYTAAHMTNHMNNVILKGLKILFVRRYATYFPPLGYREEPKTPSQDEITLLKEALVYLLGISELEAYLESIISRITEHQIREVPIYSIDELTLIRYEELLDYEEERENVPIGWILSLLKTRNCALSHVIIEDEDELEQVIALLNEYFSTQTLTVYYTTLSNCITMVRGESSLPPEMEDPDLPDDVVFTGRSLADQVHISPIGFGEYSIKETTDVYIPPLVDPIYDIQPWPITLYNRSPNHFHRFLGPANGSSTYLSTILYKLGLYGKLPNTGVYCCLADGVGEFALTLANAGNGFSRIVYHTLLENVLTGRRPEYVIQEFPHYEHNVLTDHLTEGFDNLNDVTTYIRLEEYQVIYDVITCDIEISYSDSHIMPNVYHLLGIFIFRNLAPGGIYVVKINTIYVDYVQSFLMYALELTGELIFYQPEGLRYTHWIYLIGIRNLSGGTCLYGNGMRSWSDLKGQRLRKALIRLHVYNRILVTDIDRSPIELSTFDYRYLYNARTLKMPLLAAERIATFFSLHRGDDEVNTFRKNIFNLYSPFWRDAKSNNFEWVTTYVRRVTHKLHESDELVGAMTVLPENTRAYRSLLINKLARAYGLLYMLDLFNGPTQPLVYDTTDISKAYDEFITSFEARDRYEYPDNNHYDSANISHGVTCTYFQSFQSGINIGLLIFSTGTFLTTTHTRTHEMSDS